MFKGVSLVNFSKLNPPNYSNSLILLVSRVKHYKWELYKVLRHLCKLLVKWATRKYKRLQILKVKIITAV